MSLLQEAVAAQKPKGPTCTMGLAIAAHPQLAAEVAELLADPTITGTTIARVLKPHGIEVSAYVARRHRSGECLCR